MTTQPQEPPADAAAFPDAVLSDEWPEPSTGGQWPGPTWVESQELWPAPDEWAPRDRRNSHEQWPADDYAPAPHPVAGPGPWAGDIWPGEPPFAAEPPAAPAAAGDPARGDEAAGEQPWPPGPWGTDGGWGSYGTTPDMPGAAVPPPAGPYHPDEVPPAPPRTTRGSGLRWAIAAYLTIPFFGFLVPLAVYLYARRQPRLVRAHAAQALNLALTAVMYDLSAAIMAGILALDSPRAALMVAGPLVVLLWALALRQLIRATNAAGRGEDYRIPAWLCATLVS